MGSWLISEQIFVILGHIIKSLKLGTDLVKISPVANTNMTCIIIIQSGAFCFMTETIPVVI